MTCLSIIQTAAAELGLPSPMTAIGNANANVKQLLALANREGRHLAKRAFLQELRDEAIHPSLAQEDQGSITEIAPGFDRLVPKTFWDRTEQWELPGPISGNEWQELKARDIAPSVTHFTVRGDRLLAYPAPAAGSEWAFEYYTDRWVALDAGGAGTAFQNDNDVSKIDETIIEMGVIWRWLKAKGLDYAEEKRDYEIALKQYQLTNEPRAVVIGKGRPYVRRGDFRAVGV